MVLLEFSIFPMDKGESVSPYVARCLDIVEHSGLDYRTSAMGTIIEGELDDVLGVLGRCFAELEKDCGRISCTAKFDSRRGAAGRLEAKVKSVEEKLGHPLKKG